jgi:hypothetical protein
MVADIVYFFDEDHKLSNRSTFQYPKLRVGKLLNLAGISSRNEQGAVIAAMILKMSRKI